MGSPFNKPTASSSLSRIASAIAAITGLGPICELIEASLT
jgi:hypothetical protein